jgi:hypothetical protein
MTNEAKENPMNETKTDDRLARLTEELHGWMPTDTPRSVAEEAAERALLFCDAEIAVITQDRDEWKNAAERCRECQDEALAEAADLRARLAEVTAGWDDAISALKDLIKITDADTAKVVLLKSAIAEIIATAPPAPRVAEDRALAAPPPAKPEPAPVITARARETTIIALERLIAPHQTDCRVCRCGACSDARAAIAELEAGARLAGSVPPAPAIYGGVTHCDRCKRMHHVDDGCGVRGLATVATVPLVESAVACGHICQVKIASSHGHQHSFNLDFVDVRMAEECARVLSAARAAKTETKGEP